MSAVAPVSVVIPCWRCADTVGRAVASIAAQSRLPREVILIDDASDDETPQVLRRLAESYPPGWIRVIRRSVNGGPGAARNAGWEVASSPLLAFLDADDAWFPEKLARQTDWMEAHPEVAITGHRSILWRQGDPVPPVPEPVGARKVSLAGMLVSNRFPTRSVMLRAGLPFRFPGRDETEDYALWLRIVRSGAPCMLLDAAMVCCFRPEYGAGGFSGALWRHERRELTTLARFRDEGGIGALPWAVASLWSLVKYLRRVAISTRRAFDTGWRG